MQVVFKGDGSTRAMLSLKNFVARTVFSQPFRGKATAREFLPVWDAVTDFDPEKGHIVVSGTRMVHRQTHKF